MLIESRMQNFRKEEKPEIRRKYRKLFKSRNTNNLGLRNVIRKAQENFHEASSIGNIQKLKGTIGT